MKSDDKSSHGPMISKNILFIHVHVCPMFNYVNLIIIINNKNTKTKTQKNTKTKNKIKKRKRKKTNEKYCFNFFYNVLHV